MASTQELNDRAAKAKEEKRFRIWNTPFTALDKRDQLLKLDMLADGIRELMTKGPTQKEQKQDRQESRALDMLIDTVNNMLPKVLVLEEIQKGIRPIGTTGEEFDQAIREADNKIKGLRELTGEEEVQANDYIVATYKGFDEQGEVLPNTDGEREFFIGSGALIPDLETKYIGLRVGELGRVPVKFPDDYHYEPFKGKTIEFEISVKRARRKLAA